MSKCLFFYLNSFEIVFYVEMNGFNVVIESLLANEATYSHWTSHSRVCVKPVQELVLLY